MKSYHARPIGRFTQHFERSNVLARSSVQTFEPKLMRRGDATGRVEYLCVFLDPEAVRLFVQSDIDFLGQYGFLYFSAPQIGRLAECRVWSRK